MFGKNNLIFAAFIAPFLLQGCFVTQADIGVLKTQISALNKTLQDVQRTQASADSQMQEVSIRLTQSADDIQNFDYKLDAISAKLDDVNAKFGAAQGAYQMPPSEVYEQAKTQYEAKQYDGAISGFNLYLKNAPEGANAQQAYLYLAGSYYAKKEYQKSAVAAANLLDKYPQGSLTAQARLVYARAILPLGKKDEAANYLKSIVQDFKDTPAAKEAAKELEGLK